MHTCRICRFETVLDDVVLTAANGQCICLRCYCRETDSTMAMPKELRRDVSSAINTLPIV